MHQPAAAHPATADVVVPVLVVAERVHVQVAVPVAPHLHAVRQERVERRVVVALLEDAGLAEVTHVDHGADPVRRVPHREARDVEPRGSVASGVVHGSLGGLRGGRREQQGEHGRHGGEEPEKSSLHPRTVGLEREQE